MVTAEVNPFGCFRSDQVLSQRCCVQQPYAERLCFAEVRCWRTMNVKLNPALPSIDLDCMKYWITASSLLQPETKLFTCKL